MCECGGAEQILPFWTRLFKNVCVSWCPSDALLLPQQAVDSSTASCFLFLGKLRWTSMLNELGLWSFFCRGLACWWVLSELPSCAACRTCSIVLPTEDLIRPVLFLILPWIIGVENILIWTALFWLCSHLSHTAVLCKAFSLCSESQILEWRECKNGAELLFLLTASC